MGVADGSAAALPGSNPGMKAINAGVWGGAPVLKVICTSLKKIISSVALCFDVFAAQSSIRSGNEHEHASSRVSQSHAQPP